MSGNRKTSIILSATVVTCGLVAAIWYVFGPTPIVTPTAEILNGSTEGHGDTWVERFSGDRTLRLYAFADLDPNQQRTPGIYRTTIGQSAGDDRVGIEQFARPYVEYEAGNGGVRLPIFKTQIGGNQRVALWVAVGGEATVTILTARQGFGKYQGSLELSNVELECQETGERCRLDSLPLGPVEFGSYPR